MTHQSKTKNLIALVIATSMVLCASVMVSGLSAWKKARSLDYSSAEGALKRLHGIAPSAETCTRVLSLAESGITERKAMSALLAAQAKLQIGLGLAFFGVGVIAILAYSTAQRSGGD